MIKNIFKIKMFDDDGRPIASIKARKPKELKDIVDDWFDKLL